ncbi:MAG TPA: serine O-acetyltransferase EpsC [Chryseosolibacter sp.]|nr:serine O-acetyltransferase EpsC [Chryseosolibacter sp.]
MKAFWKKLYETHQACPECATRTEIGNFFSSLLGVLFPDYAEHSFKDQSEFDAYVAGLRQELHRIVTQNASASDSHVTADIFFDDIPKIYQKLNQDVEAMFDGDPAAKSRAEVIRTYPGFYAIAAYRIGHALHQLGIALVPRIITEIAHSKTGIDIHPAATIGSHFCIDHGTGVVIGETTLIGDRVKIYQGVTLGALSVSKADAERKRHPTIENDVVIYAGATILGGETVIGHDSIIGGNVWLTKSVPPHSKIYYQSKMYKGDDTDVVVFRPE